MGLEIETRLKKETKIQGKNKYAFLLVAHLERPDNAESISCRQV